jgi:hypothetical protein
MNVLRRPIEPATRSGHSDHTVFDAETSFLGF